MKKPTEHSAEEAAAKLTAERARADIVSWSHDVGWNLISATRLRLPPGEVELPPLDAHTVAVHYSGTVHIERILEGTRADGVKCPGHVGLDPPHAKTKWRFNNSFDVLLVHLNTALIQQVIEEEAEVDGKGIEIAPTLLFRDHAIERIANALMLEMTAPRFATRMYAETAGRWLALHLLRHHSNMAATDKRSLAIPPAKLRRAIAYLEDNLERPVLVAEMAASVDMSAYHFAKSFKKTTGSPPHKYLLSRRMEKAKLLLTESDLDMSAVSASIGLQSQSYFSTIFQRHAGLTPTQYRKVTRSDAAKHSISDPKTSAGAGNRIGSSNGRVPNDF